ncbi:MAG: hypothetical protein NTZ20_05230 [Candidatus Levybacteria bacterium]|nr:hypothetical protein [Candidatus Levybacteria bacterium]
MGALNIHWDRLEQMDDSSKYMWGKEWNEFCNDVSSIPQGYIWRHNQAGDLPMGDDGLIDQEAIQRLVVANNGKRGFTYTHHDMTIEHNKNMVKAMNENGFTVNLSANNLAEADTLVDMQIGPVVVILDAQNGIKADTVTPGGRKVITCPATYRQDVTCLSCKLCAKSNRNTIVGFPAHGVAKKVVREIAGG